MDGKGLLRRKTRRGSRPRTEVGKVSSATHIPLTEVASLFRCGKCLAAPIKPPVFTCRNGHLNCASCYHALNRDCYKCKEPLLGRNQVLEDVMRSLPTQTCEALSNCSASLRESRSEQSLRMSLQDPELLEKLELARKEAEVQDRRKSEAKKSLESRESRLTELGGSITSCSSIASLDSLQIRSSSRPITCPFPCNRIVTCSGLVPHFEFHHPDVLLSKVNKNCDVEIKIPYNDIKYTDEEEGRCVIFFVVKIDDSDDDGEDFSKSADLLRVARSSQEMIRRGYFVALLSAGLLPSGLDKNSHILAVWLSALYDFAPVTYTLRISDTDGTHHFSFRGYPSSLHKKQRPKDIYQRGECLAVPPALLRHFHSPGHNLDLTITFHSDLPFPFVLPVTPTSWIPDTQGLIL